MRPGERGDANAEFPTPREAISPVLKPERFRSTRRHDTTRDVSRVTERAFGSRTLRRGAGASLCASRPYFGRFSIRQHRFGRVAFFFRREWVFGNVTNVTYYPRFVRRCPDTIVLDAQHGHPADSSVTVVVVVSTPPRATRRNTERRDVRDGECVRRRAARGVFPPRRLSPSSTRRARVDSQTPPSLRACVRPVACPSRTERRARDARVSASKMETAVRGLDDACVHPSAHISPCPRRHPYSPTPPRPVQADRGASRADIQLTHRLAPRSRPLLALHSRFGGSRVRAPTRGETRRGRGDRRDRLFLRQIASQHPPSLALLAGVYFFAGNSSTNSRRASATATTTSSAGPFASPPETRRSTTRRESWISTSDVVEW